MTNLQYSSRILVQAPGGEGDSHVSRGFSFKTKCNAESNGHKQDEGRKQDKGNGRGDLQA